MRFSRTRVPWKIDYNAAPVGQRISFNYVHWCAAVWACVRSTMIQSNVY